MKRLHEKLERICRGGNRSVGTDAFRSVIRRIDRETLLASAGRFGTPQYFLDLDNLRERASRFVGTMRGHMPLCECYYAFKCNDLPLLVRTVKETGFQADVAGPFELRLALRLGFERILFSGPGKSAGELTCAVENRDRVVVVVDNVDELLLLREIASGAGAQRRVEVGFRLNAGGAPNPRAPWTKFGFELDQLPDAVRIADESADLEWTGLHFHTSWNKAPGRYVERIERIGAFLATHLPTDRLRRLRFFDIGGGFYPEGQAILNRGTEKGILLDILEDRPGNGEELGETPPFDPFSFEVTDVAPLETFAADIARSVSECIAPLNPGISIYLEPGRYIATHPTTILLSVLAVKQDRVIVDGGINMVGDYQFSEYAFAPIVDVSRPSDRPTRRIIYGPLCDPGDLWGYSCYAEELRAGDLLAVLHQGAYTFSTAWRFIKPIPPYVAFSRGGGFVVAKEEERFEDRYAGCRM